MAICGRRVHEDLTAKTGANQRGKDLNYGRREMGKVLERGALLCLCERMLALKRKGKRKINESKKMKERG